MTDAFQRADDGPDEDFYLQPRLVTHIDDGAIAAVTATYDRLFGDGADVLDLMSSWRSHLASGHQWRVAGLGMNDDEMAANPQLDTYAVHNLNLDPHLPFDDAGFDAVACCVSVQYLTRPLEVFADVARVLRPGGVFVLTFSNRCFPTKAVAAWLYGDDNDHIGLVAGYFQATPAFGPAQVESHRPRRGDPLYAVWSERG